MKCTKCKTTIYGLSIGYHWPLENKENIICRKCFAESIEKFQRGFYNLINGYK